MGTHYDNIVLITAFIAGLSLMTWGGYAFVTTQVEDATDCTPVCVIDGVQYKPMPHGGECWCDMKKGRALTD